MTKNKIFISHSSKDLNFVKFFIENILLLGLDIPSERIFCSSMEGQGIKSGQYIPDSLKEEINKSALALLFISKNYKSSEICLNEIGATWAVLDKENIIPILLPDVDFGELGVLNLSRLGLKLYERAGIVKLVQDRKEQLNPNFNLEKLDKKIGDYLSEISKLHMSDSPAQIHESIDCFMNNLYPLNEIIRKSIPAHEDGIHKIDNIKTQNQLLIDLSQAKFLKHFWYRYASGDYYIEKLKRLPTGNWLLSAFNREIKISQVWVCMNSEENQYEFILIRTEKMSPFNIDSDIGGTSYCVGVLQDGIVVSDNERLNGYAIINGETINLHEHGIERRIRDSEPHWAFLVSKYHKVGYNENETIAFCKKLDKGSVKVSEENIYNFLRPLPNNPVILTYR